MKLIHKYNFIKMGTTKKDTVKQRSFDFALEIIETYKILIEKKEYILSKQLLRSGTSIGAMICEAGQAESKADFIHKMAIALKEASETKYWLKLLVHSEYLSEDEFSPLSNNVGILLRMLTKIIKTARNRS